MLSGFACCILSENNTPFLLGQMIRFCKCLQKATDRTPSVEAPKSWRKSAPEHHVLVMQTCSMKDRSVAQIGLVVSASSLAC